MQEMYTQSSTLTLQQMRATMWPLSPATLMKKPRTPNPFPASGVPCATTYAKQHHPAHRRQDCSRKLPEIVWSLSGPRSASDSAHRRVHLTRSVPSQPIPTIPRTGSGPVHVRLRWLSGVCDSCQTDRLCATVVVVANWQTRIACLTRRTNTAFGARSFGLNGC
jgi:hypothetical protein